ncbi:FDXHR family putative zinc-binding protein [Gordonia insulae]
MKTKPISCCRTPFNPAVRHCVYCCEDFADERAFFAHRDYRSCRVPAVMEKMTKSKGVWHLS